MKENESEWTSVSDLMASIIAVLVIFLVALMKLQHSSKPSSEEIKVSQARKKITNILKEFGSVMENGQNTANVFEIDTANQSITLKNGAFDLGNPCLILQADSTLRANSGNIKILLLSYNNLIITIEGYADTSAFKGSENTSCGNEYYSYSDNVTLSLARAQQTRDILLINWNNTHLSERVAVLGYGATQQLEGKTNEENRRVVFKFEFRDTGDLSMERGVVSKLKF